MHDLSEIRAPRRSSKRKFDFCSYEKFVIDESYRDSCASASEYSQQFILKHKTDENLDKDVKIVV